ncbi:MAG: flippase-like domain-containing protein [Bacteroidetes bacterium]|nr:flippase-like domain-containing protein [Bacteroidota bacterium]
MNKRLSKFLKFLAFLALGVFVLWLVYRGQDINKVLSDMRKADFAWVLVTILFGLFSHIFRALRWQMLIKTLGYRPKLLTTFGAVMIGYLTNLALPRAGEIARCVVIKRAEKAPLDSLVGTIVVERGADLIMLVIITFFAVVLQVGLLGGFLKKWLVDPITAGISNNSTSIIIFSLSILVFLVTVYLVYKYYLPRFREHNIYKRLKKIIIGFVEGLKSITRMKNKGMFILYSVLVWSMYLLMGYAGFYTIQCTSHLGLMESLSVLVMASLAYTIPVPGGLGTYHFFITEGLKLYNIEAACGNVYAAINHSAQTLFIIVLGGIFLFLTPFLTRAKKYE